ncbi:hypothetical protein [Polyangium spumosum]|uniref:Uncharacterized protein n=1 Tax=Polyangium spumosum TaxID=889282 RepID=A0A6N7PS13_9BACT|nr:hypothetical protein [Polyangium spumosum]MRG91651.1 hypothetical protein [Polyangium spumosum]
MAPRSLQSNWGVTVEARFGLRPRHPSAHDDDNETPEEDGGEESTRQKQPAVMRLDAAALVLGISTDDPTWRRRVTRRIRAAERAIGREILIPQVGRTGCLVRTDGLLELAPFTAAVIHRQEKLEARVDALERQVAELRREPTGATR